MGVPKFFRYISERYPCLSESVKEYQIPEFDNLYLDMNGIIHNCSHPDDGNPHFRITEEKIFADIFHYIEVLFRMIKPHKVFFMAIDGVAPRAKMNQQRGRRFRSAKDAQKLEDEAVKKGEVLPTESRFDSNCITPGTEFMARLHEQLKYFVVKKVSQDPLWQRCQVILSGHETPGEGEHKIMDFIRFKRSQPDYDPNTRHCLYGLDADLIMLGLCTHDPHFSLLREEVKFGKKSSSKRNCVPEEIRFFLLHLSLMREYLEMEFAALKTSLKSFKFDIEKIIDDWVLMGFLVGNDFIPNLPNLHIANGTLPVLYKAYMEILPTLEGYINEGGILNLKRFEIFMKKLGEIDLQNFEDVRDDLLYMEMKTGRKAQPFAKNTARPKHLQMWKPEEGEEAFKPEILESLEPENKIVRDSGLQALIASTEDEYMDDDGGESATEDDDDEEFRNYKKSYYMSKLEYAKVTPEVLKSQAEGYVRAIQWNLHYYYNGVCSWSWFYPHHYSPYISDIKDFQNLKLEYDIGKPFMPYEQLLAVLPAASKRLLPNCYQKLMTDENSVIKKYYPENFETDLNGKRQEWEAVVLIPFIDEEILLDAMKSCNDELDSHESERNRHGPMLCYKYTEEDLGPYEAPKYFPKICNNHAKLQPITIDELKVPIENLVKGAYPGVLMDVYYPGFPTFKHLEYEGRLKAAKVKVFDQASRGDNMLVNVTPSERVLTGNFPLELLGKTVYVGWPHLKEAKVVALENSKEKYNFVAEGVEPNVEAASSSFKYEVENVVSHYNNRLGIQFGKVIVLVKVQTMIGQKYMITPNNRISLEKKFSQDTSNYPLQLIVENINVYTESRDLFPTLETLFPVHSICFLLSPDKYYGCKGIIKKDDKTPEGRICVGVVSCKEPNLTRAKNLANDTNQRYRTAHQAADQLGVTNLMFARITGSYFVTAKNKEGCPKSVNLGLDLKFNKKNSEIPGFTKKIGGSWYYTDAAIDLVDAYIEEFPEIFDYLATYSQNDKDISAEDIFPVNSDDKVKAVQAWLKSQAHSKVEKRTCGAAVLDKEIVEEIEKTIDSFSSDKSHESILYLKPNLLYKAELCFGNLLPDASVQVQLFDRIVNVRANHSVPLGLRGTIIGISKATEDSMEPMYEVVFDDKFEGGIDINCSNGRGYRLPLNSFINISHGERKFQPQTVSKSHNQDFVQKKYQNYNLQNSKYTNNVNFTNSAFAKFSTNNSSTSYNAVPPFMPNGEPIYDSFKLQNNRQNYNFSQSRQKYPDYNNPRSEQPLNFLKPQFNKPSSSSNYGRSPANNEIKTRPQSSEPKVKSPPEKPDFMPVFRRFHQDEVQETADVLKKLLNISTETDVAVQNVSKRKEQKPQNNPFSQDIPQKELQPKKDNMQAVTKELATVQLLSYYQSKGLGLPRYQYLTSQLGTQCQIKLPNRAIIIGTPGRDREEASEIVADLALKALHLRGNVSNDNVIKPMKNQSPCANEQRQIKESPKKIPTPPKQWWGPQRDVRDQPPKTNRSMKLNTDNTWKGMIPLQAVKKVKANTSSRNKTVKENTDETNKKLTKTVLSEKTDTSNAKEKTEIIEKKEDKPKRRLRKMRIAANFGMNK